MKMRRHQVEVKGLDRMPSFGRVEQVEEGGRHEKVACPVFLLTGGGTLTNIAIATASGAAEGALANAITNPVFGALAGAVTSWAVGAGSGLFQQGFSAPISIR